MTVLQLFYPQTLPTLSLPLNWECRCKTEECNCILSPWNTSAYLHGHPLAFPPVTVHRLPLFSLRTIPPLGHCFPLPLPDSGTINTESFFLTSASTTFPSLLDYYYQHTACFNITHLKISLHSDYLSCCVSCLKLSILTVSTFPPQSLLHTFKFYPYQYPIHNILGLCFPWPPHCQTQRPILSPPLTLSLNLMDIDKLLPSGNAFFIWLLRAMPLWLSNYLLGYSYSFACIQLLKDSFLTSFLSALLPCVIISIPMALDTSHTWTIPKCASLPHISPLDSRFIFNHLHFDDTGRLFTISRQQLITDLLSHLLKPAYFLIFPYIGFSKYI